MLVDGGDAPVGDGEAEEYCEGGDAGENKESGGEFHARRLCCWGPESGWKGVFLRKSIHPLV